jgi:hypothetical protein
MKKYESHIVTEVKLSRFYHLKVIKVMVKRDNVKRDNVEKIDYFNIPIFLMFI